MISRYTTPEMARIWSEENKFRAWLEVEIAVCEVLADRGEIPADAVEVIREKADFSLDRILEIEKGNATRCHCLYDCCRRKRWSRNHGLSHLGLTSTDVVDTAQALRVKEASDLSRICHPRNIGHFERSQAFSLQRDCNDQAERMGSMLSRLPLES